MVESISFYDTIKSIAQPYAWQPFNVFDKAYRFIHQTKRTRALRDELRASIAENTTLCEDITSISPGDMWGPQTHRMRRSVVLEDGLLITERQCEFPGRWRHLLTDFSVTVVDLKNKREYDIKKYSFDKEPHIVEVHHHGTPMIPALIYQMDERIAQSGRGPIKLEY